MFGMKNKQTKEKKMKRVMAKEETRVIRDAYGITDQLYDAFTRGQ